MSTREKLKDARTPKSLFEVREKDSNPRGEKGHCNRLISGNARGEHVWEDIKKAR